VTINGERAAQRAARDSAGRMLPTWSGCRTLHGEVFLLGDTPDSFDGRYWGPTPLRLVEGVWRPV
jgi:type IV secretory pathway protease TraF